MSWKNSSEEGRHFSKKFVGFFSTFDLIIFYATTINLHLWINNTY
jgi:hypothetical protein